MSNRRLAQRRGAQRGWKSQQSALVIWTRGLGDVAPHEAWQAGTLVSGRGQSVCCESEAGVTGSKAAYLSFDVGHLLISVLVKALMNLQTARMGKEARDMS